ncbi:hypothetical protein AND_008277 [Anopheles darlingi]|uniref:C-type lectin domain-containing protein n=1 Tax=Anopheles darlingi TaxID=43151 RepID=W5JB84_ANODA|nr:hypothetical protein AND_008277 [Anopheles darlingi]
MYPEKADHFADYPRANVNISNTWTLPQEGFSVFYRYFRDKISWFEADAVCQFHHANLVTVDNGVQFDATRAFLKELDVTSAVWIGLMRPENSARFTWTSSKALDPGSSGYWAEALPAMEQPLCAVVDPTRDFRWHALRCGGPETAAFLCELPVPSWAVDCTITSIPSLTVQYMSDSGTVQLARDCGESGTKHISCQGKQDRDSIVQQLQCSETEDLASALANDNNNNSNNSSNSNSNRLLAVVATADADATSSSMAALQPILEHDILTVVSSNDDDVSSSSSSSSTGSSTGSSISSSSVSSGPSSIDSIVINSNQIEDTVKNVIKKFDLQGLLQQQQQSGDAGPGNGESGSRRVVVDESGGATSGPRKVHATGYAKKYSPLYEKKPHYVKKAVLGPDAPEELVVDDEQEEQEEEEEEEREREREEEEEEEEERMMGDQPLLDETETQPIDIIQEAVKPTADGDYPLGEPAPQHPTATGLPVLVLASSSSSPPGEEDLTTMTTTTPTATTTVDSRLRRATDSGDDATTTTMTSTTSTETSTTTTTVAPVTSTTTASHILPTTPRKEVITGDHFIPPMLLVKARFISARPHTEPPPTTVTTPQKPTTTAVTDPTTNTGDNQPSTVHPEDVPSTLDDDGSTDVATPTQGTSNDSNDIQTQSDQSVTPSPSPSPSPSPVANNGTLATVPVGQLQRLSTATPDVKPEIGSSSPAAPVQQEEQQQQQQQTSVPTATEEHQEEEEEEHGDGDGEDGEQPRTGTTELHNSFSNVENYQPYKPNRHRALTKAEQHHNPGNYIKKILG